MLNDTGLYKGYKYEETLFLSTKVQFSFTEDKTQDGLNAHFTLVWNLSYILYPYTAGLFSLKSIIHMDVWEKQKRPIRFP